MPRRLRIGILGGVVCVIALASAAAAQAESDIVHHERTSTDAGGGCGPFAAPLFPTSTEVETIRWRVPAIVAAGGPPPEFQNIPHLYYTTDGSAPSGMGGASSGTTTGVTPLIEDTCPTSNNVAEVAIPAQPNGTFVRYIVSSDVLMGGGIEEFENHSTALCHVSSCAIVFGYVVGGGTLRPSLSTSAGQVPYTAGASAVPVDPSLTLGDSDSLDLTAATVTIASGFQAGDALAFTAGGGVTGSYNSGTGVLTLTGTASVTAYRDALRSVTFFAPAGSPTRTLPVSFTASDAEGSSIPASRSIAVTGQSPPPGGGAGGGGAAPGTSPGPTGRQAAALKKCKKKKGAARKQCKKKALKLPV